MRNELRIRKCKPLINYRNTQPHLIFTSLCAACVHFLLCCLCVWEEDCEREGWGVRGTSRVAPGAQRLHTSTGSHWFVARTTWTYCTDLIYPLFVCSFVVYIHANIPIENFVGQFSHYFSYFKPTRRWVMFSEQEIYVLVNTFQTL